ncbi:respiratory nitrate reductase chaperone NarJ [Sanguibacter gelidistatuariae]|uniref:Respiratory nitrate reductase chaperone NarJ n=1 Tax=Sanguibacter gelidistatuariae TaxID=1814289 RepID=A0A1G6GS51_9MICO|nr:nitrate reductase molybdenum cofactor assembly chaperone [Sanguibacter gelidistatuariae]SDB83996.1 respiratory nitrate reductase chaperone NarJ [Sanguibacter gelidistatuariae]
MALRPPPHIKLSVMPEPTPAIAMTRDQRALTHMATSLLLDYPDGSFHTRTQQVAAAITTLPDAVRRVLETFLATAMAADAQDFEKAYVGTFDLKRKCCLYLSYYAAGDTRRRGQALVTFMEAYRAAGWEFDAEELPDYLPAVLEFSAVSESPIAEQLLAAHREGIEVLRAALLAVSSPYAGVIEAVCMSLPEIDDATRDRYLALVNEGPPTETVGLTFLGDLQPFSAGGAAPEEARR